jgi:hypothetical protein
MASRICRFFLCCSFFAQRVLIVGSQTAASLSVSVSNTPTVTANAGTGTFTVQFDPGHELGSIRGNSTTLTVFLPDTGHELGTIRGNTNTLTVFLPDTGHEIGTIRGNTNTLTVFIPDTGHEIGAIRSITNTIGINSVTPSGSTIADSNHRADRVLIVGSHAAASLAVSAAGSGTFSVFIPDTGHTLGKVDAGTGMFNTGNTASIFTTSGSSSAVSTSGLTIISPSANYSFKVFAFSLTTTGILSKTCKFTNGSGASPTEYWRVGLQAPTTASTGANLSVQPPGYLFATGTSTTLSLVLDNASLVHYSVSYIKESA